MNVFFLLDAALLNQGGKPVMVIVGAAIGIVLLIVAIVVATVYKRSECKDRKCNIFY